jgi:hypothetical protein
MTIKMGMKDAPAPSEGKSKGPYISAGKKSEGKEKRSKGTSKSKDDNKFEWMLGGATSLNDGQIADDYDQMGVQELMSTEVPTQKSRIAAEENTTAAARARPIQGVIRLKFPHALALP